MLQEKKTYGLKIKAKSLQLGRQLTTLPAIRTTRASRGCLAYYCIEYRPYRLTLTRTVYPRKITGLSLLLSFAAIAPVKEAGALGVQELHLPNLAIATTAAAAAVVAARKVCEAHVRAEGAAAWRRVVRRALCGGDEAARMADEGEDVGGGAGERRPDHDGEPIARGPRLAQARRSAARVGVVDPRGSPPQCSRRALRNLPPT